jgi:Ni/Co efflux regulator RcnB
MKRLLIATTALTLLVAPLSGAFAQGRNDRHDDNRNNSMMMQRHDNDLHDNNNHNWRKGGRIERNDWNRGRRVSDWQHRHLQRPPRGYEWRQVDNNYVLAAVAGGLIASVILAGSH